MARESLQKRLIRVRPPRVEITYELESAGAVERRQIPFVIGVLADLSGQSRQKKQRRSVVSCRSHSASLSLITSFRRRLRTCTCSRDSLQLPPSAPPL